MPGYLRILAFAQNFRAEADKHSLNRARMESARSTPDNISGPAGSTIRP